MYGCRLWYRQSSASRDVTVTHEKLCTLDVLPHCIHASDKHPKFETLSYTVDRINQRLMEQPLDGKNTVSRVPGLVTVPDSEHFFILPVTSISATYRYRACSTDMCLMSYCTMHFYPGDIICAETVRLKVPQEDWSADVTIETEQSMWPDEYNVHLLSFIRIYYRKHQTVLQRIGPWLRRCSRDFLM